MNDTYGALHGVSEKVASIIEAFSTFTVGEAREFRRVTGVDLVHLQKVCRTADGVFRGYKIVKVTGFRTIQAIKHIREVFRLGLKESKDAVDGVSSIPGPPLSYDEEDQLITDLRECGFELVRYYERRV